jgi:hypothetical protein
MPNQKGGVKKKFSGKPPQDILRDTLESAGVVLNVISDGSLKSFVFEIIINDPNAREYIDTDESGGFRNPVERLVMKILITTPNGTGSSSFSNAYVGIDGVPRSKASETPNDIHTEARVQQEAWQNTVVNGRVPVCPSVADLIFFDNTHGEIFITYLQRKFATGNARMSRVCTYILEKLKIPARGICVMVMPEVSAPQQVLAPAGAAAAPAQVLAPAGAAAAPQQVLAPAGAAAAPQQASITLEDFINLADGSIFQGLTVDKEQKNRAYSLITACVMRLYLVGIIDFDLHDNNFILYVDQNGVLQGKIIDLGNSIIFTNGTNKFIVDSDDIKLLKLGLDTYKNDIIGDAGNDTFIHKAEIVVDLLDMIKEFDTKGNRQVFPHIQRFAGQDDHTNCQMGWWQTIKDKEAADTAGTDQSFSYIINNAYNLARAGIMGYPIAFGRAGVSRASIKQYIRQGKIASFTGRPNPSVAWLWAAAQAQAQAPPPAPQGQGPQAQGFQGPPTQGPPTQGQGPQVPQNPNDMDFIIGGGARKKTSKKRKFRKTKTKRLALRKTKSKKTKKNIKK